MTQKEIERFEKRQVEYVAFLDNILADENGTLDYLQIWFPIESLESVTKTLTHIEIKMFIETRWFSVNIENEMAIVAWKKIKHIPR